MEGYPKRRNSHFPAKTAFSWTSGNLLSLVVCLVGDEAGKPCSRCTSDNYTHWFGDECVMGPIADGNQIGACANCGYDGQGYKGPHYPPHAKTVPHTPSRRSKAEHLLSCHTREFAKLPMSQLVKKQEDLSLQMCAVVKATQQHLGSTGSGALTNGLRTRIIPSRKSPTRRAAGDVMVRAFTTHKNLYTLSGSSAWARMMSRL
ncbi:hypothetical protein F5883DRAFT_525258 [Diaporthe sp. PMI_573]|nr:hypothetical protein F5883DRAFT_525258 [Diaporthaceae sp. PMI_573]